MDRHADALLRQAGGTTYRRHLTLIFIDAAPTPLTQRDLASGLGVSQAAVSRSIASLVEDGLVHTESAGGRSRALSLTPHGHEVLTLGNTALAQGFDAVVQQSGHDADALAATISDLISQLESIPVPPPVEEGA